MPLDRTWYNSLVDDDGSGLTGTIWDKHAVNVLMTTVDTELAPDGCSATAVSRQTMTQSAMWIAVEYDNVLWQSPSTMCFPPTNVITIRTAGYYLVTGAVTFPQGTGVRGLAVYANGANAPGLGGQQILTVATPETYTVLNLSAILYLNASDYVQLAAYQNSGAPIALGALGLSATNHMQVMRLRR